MFQHTTKQANTVDRRFKAKANNTHKPQARAAVNSRTIQITTTVPMVKILDEVVRTGLYGTSRAAAAERLLSEGIRQLLKEGMIKKQAQLLENGK